MFKIFTTAAALFCATGLTTIVQSANSAERILPMKLCATNSNCSFGEPDASGVTLFKIESQRRVAFVRCDTTGNCWQMFPKKGAVRIVDVTRVFAAK